MRYLLPAILLLPTLALAQQTPAAMQDRMERLERDMNVLQSHVYRGQGAAVKKGEDGEVDIDAAMLAQQQQYLAGLEVKITALEDGLRQINGRLEELEFANKKTAEDLKKLSEDVDFRFNQLGSGPAAATSPQSGPGTRVLGTVVVDPLKDEPLVKGKKDTKDVGDPKARYDAAFALLRQSKYPEAEKAFNAWLLDFPDHELAGSSYYWLGETHYVRKEYEEAAVEFMKGYRKAPTGPKAPDNLLKLGTSLGFAKKNDEACTVFGKLKKEFPNAAAPIKRKAELETTKLKCN